MPSQFSGAQAWRDSHVRFEGSAVRVLQRVFAEAPIAWLRQPFWTRLGQSGARLLSPLL